ncbi:hypothetical protein ACSNOK_17815 [Streptomyces sp. URMC 126]|uniref:hypothetical protein n=1 Tax=Streptomyces sp. URMC 126 TaxID=3423401 RepID=UPI003F19ED2B
MSVRNKGISAAMTFAMTGALFGIGIQAAQADSPKSERNVIPASAPKAADMGVATAGADEICAVLGIGSGAAGLSKALAKGASWVGIGASIGCYAYTKAKNATPAEKRAAMIKSYKNYQAKSDLKKLEALGYYCRKKGGGGGGGTDFAPLDAAVRHNIVMPIGYRDIKMKGVTYTCGNTRD